MDKQLFIACRKENFEYLDFWEKYREPALKAMATLVQFARKEGRLFPAERLLPYPQKPTDWPDNIVAADTTLNSFSATLSKFGITFDHTGEIMGWLGFKMLDPKNKERTPEWASHVLVCSEPTVIQLQQDFDSPREWPVCWNLADLVPDFEDMLPDIAEDMLPNAGTPLPPLRTLKSSQRLLLVDLSRKKGEILADFKAFLDKVYNLRTQADQLLNDSWEKHYAQWSPYTNRMGKPWNQLKVWRMRKEKIPFSEIARAMGITEDAAKKAFYKAYELTQGRPYEPDRYRKDGQKINTWDMTKTCQTCPDRQTCSELCPEILRFADQDYTGRKENLLTY